MKRGSPSSSWVAAFKSFLSQRGSILGLAVLLAFLAWLYISTLKPGTIGFYYDDGVYFTAAKSLSKGLGYSLLNEPSLKAIIKYPPLFPVVLAPLWRIFPSFPENIFWFKLLSAFFTLSTLAVLYRYANWRLQSHQGRVGLLLAVAVGTEYQLLWVSTALFSEPFYMLLSVFCVFYLEKQWQEHKTFSPLGAAALSALVFYTRTVGIALFPAIVLCLWLANQRSKALQYMGWYCLFTVPWFVWTWLHPAVDMHVYNALLVSYNHNYWLDLVIAYQNFGGLTGIVKAGCLYTTEALLKHLLPILDVWQLPLLNSTINAVLSLGLWGGLLLASSMAIRSRNIQLSWAYCIFYLLIMVFWVNDHAQYSRLLLPISPFLLIFLWERLQQSRWKQWLAGVVLLQFVFANWTECWNYHQVSIASTQSTSTATLWQEYQQTFSFIRKQLPSQSVIFTQYPIPYWLYTGHPTLEIKVYPFQIGQAMTSTSQDPRPLMALYNWLKAKNVSYVIIEPEINASEASGQGIFHALVTASDLFPLVYSSPQRSIQIYQVR